MQDKLIMVSSSIITNCQLSTKMIEGIHIFWSGERADRSWVPIITGCAYTGTALCSIMFRTEAESAIWCKILVLFSKAVIFHLFEYLQVAFFFAENLCICVKSEEICVKLFMFFRALGLRWVAEAWSVYWDELTVMWRWVTFSGGFSFLRRMHNVHCKKIFFAKMQGLYWV